MQINNRGRINYLWLTMQSAFGNNWSNQFGQKDNGTWEKALEAVPDDVFTKATQLVIRSRNPFPPNLSQFQTYCASAIGLPTQRMAFDNACHANWSHPVVYETAKRIGTFTLRGTRERDIYPLWQMIYGDVCNQWMAGKRFKEPKQQQISTPKSVKCSLIKGSEFMKKIRDLLK
jgi:hypothetical protein